MLQSSNQYLRPDYLVAPTALDAKSSPLALLAQTCSAIGADTANPKLLAANIEKATKSLKSSTTSTSNDCNDKSSPVSSHSSSVSTGSVEQQQQQQQQQQQIKSSFKPYESNNNHLRDRLDGITDLSSATNLTNNQNSQRVKTPKNSGTTNGHQQRCDSNQSATSQRDSPATATTNGLRRTPTAATPLDMQRLNGCSPHRVSSKDSPLTTATSAASAATVTTTRSQHAVSDATFAAAAKEASYVKALQAAAAAAGANASSAGGGASAYYSGYPVAGAGGATGIPYSMDLMTASALMSSQHHSMFKAAALNPYLNYARLKGLMDPATAAAMMSPNICRDPYCTGCPSNPHFLNKAAGQPCPAGCPQCESQSNAAVSAKSVNANNNNSSASAAAAAAAAASTYHAQLAALAAASQMPYVCSWIGNDASYCGKRFSTSDELFQHLRTHTASMPDSVLSAAAAGGIPPNHPIFQRTYPTPPLSPLSAAARYHPYAKPSSMLPPSLGPPPGALAGLPMPPHPALAQYFSPYALYGPRMGSSSHP